MKKSRHPTSQINEPPPVPGRGRKETPVPSCSSLLNGLSSTSSSGLKSESNRLYYWSSLRHSNPQELTDNPRSNGGGGSTVLFDDHSNNLAVNNKNNNTSPLPNFRLNFVKKMEDSLILRLPQGSCDTTPDTPDSLDDDSVDHTSLPPTPVPIPVSDLPLPKPPLSTQNHEPANSPDPWLMHENLIEEISAPPNAVCSSASSPATPIGSPQAQNRSFLRSVSQIRLHNTHNNQQSLLHKKSLDPHKVDGSSTNKSSRIYSSLYPQMVVSNSFFEKNSQVGAKNDANNNNSKDLLENRTLKSQTTLTTTTTKVFKSNLDESLLLIDRKKLPQPTARYATIGSSSKLMKRSTIVNNNNRIINANLSSTTLHCTSSDREASSLLPLQPPPYQDPPKYRKPRTTISMENNPAHSSSSCFTIDSAMNSLNNNNNNNSECLLNQTEETQNAILKDLQRHMSYELLENPIHMTSEEEEEDDEQTNHVEADVRVSTSSSCILQIKSKSLPAIARVQQQNQLTNGHVYKLGAEETDSKKETQIFDPIQDRLRNDSLSTLNEVNSSKIAHLSSGSSSLIDKLRCDTNREQLEELQRNNILDYDRCGAGPGRNRVDSIVDRDLLDEKDEKHRKPQNGTSISREPESCCRLTSTDDDFESTDEEHLRSTLHRKYRRKRSSLSHPDSIEETDNLDDLDEDFDQELEDPEMEICDPCQCYAKCCLDMVASIFCVSLL